MADKIRIAIAGLGNCASSLLQGIEFYRARRGEEAIGLMHYDLGGFRPQDIEIVAAFDIDRRKVGKEVHEAIFAPPNCTRVFHSEMPRTGVKVSMGRILDGVADHMKDFDEARTFVPSDARQPERADVVAQLRSSGAEILLNYLPVGSQEATEFYAECALEAGVGFINNMPVFIASDERWAQRFRQGGVPVLGDDIKSQLGATIVHRTLSNLFRNRGVRIERTYQLNTGGNTDFLNMLNRTRLASKKISKTEAVQTAMASRLESDNIHIGPSDYVPWQKDNKVCFIRIEGTMFGEVPMELEMRLSVEDSPNSAGVAIDSIRCMKLALDRGLAGPLIEPSAFFCKHPPQQFSEAEAFDNLETFIRG